LYNSLSFSSQRESHEIIFLTVKALLLTKNILYGKKGEGGHR
jgi:hypothetical protein